MRGPDSGCVFSNWLNHHLITVVLTSIGHWWRLRRRKLFTWLALLEICCICSFQDNLRSIVTPSYLVYVLYISSLLLMMVLSTAVSYCYLFTVNVCVYVCAQIEAMRVSY